MGYRALTLGPAVASGVMGLGGGVNGIQLHNGMRAKVADAAMVGAAPVRYPPNPVALVVLASLGQPLGAWGLTTSLTAHQLELVDRAYRLATQA
jgi:hypothetical protein